MAQGRIDHQGHPALRNRADLCHGERDLIGGKAHIFGVEVTARNNPTSLDQHQRVIGHRVGLNLQRARGHAQHVERRAHHLRLAADAIGILYAGVALTVAFAYFRPVHDVAHHLRHIDLPRMTTQGVYVGHQRCGGAHDRIGRQRRNCHGCPRQIQRLKQPSQRASGRELRSVDKSKAFFRPQHDRLQPRAFQRFGSGQAFAFKRCLTLTNHRRSHMRQRSKVARCAH